MSAEPMRQEHKWGALCHASAVLMFVATVKAGNGVPYRYPISIPFLR